MADLFSWSDLGRWAISLTRRGIPNAILRCVWSPKDLLARIESFHFDQAPRFHVGTDLDNANLQFSGFNLINLTPFQLWIVGVDIHVSIDSRDLFRYEKRFPAEIPMPHSGRSGFIIQQVLSDSQAARVRKYDGDWVLLRLAGDVILRTPFGEQRKEVRADIVATIDRGLVRAVTGIAAPTWLSTTNLPPG